MLAKKEKATRYREAARQIAEKELEFSCTAINDYVLNLVYRQIFELGDGYSGSGNAHIADLWQEPRQEQINRRVLMLCLAADIVETGGI